MVLPWVWSRQADALLGREELEKAGAHSWSFLGTHAVHCPLQLPELMTFDLRKLRPPTAILSRRLRWAPGQQIFPVEELWVGRCSNEVLWLRVLNLFLLLLGAHPAGRELKPGLLLFQEKWPSRLSDSPWGIQAHWPNSGSLRSKATIEKQQQRMAYVTCSSITATGG